MVRTVGYLKGFVIALILLCPGVAYHASPYDGTGGGYLDLPVGLCMPTATLSVILHYCTGLGAVRYGPVLSDRYKGLVINYGEGGGGLQMGKSLVRNFLHPPSRQGKTFRTPPPF